MAERATVPLNFDLTGKVALVTGASRGIGYAIAQRLAQQGATVLGTATSQAGVDNIEQLLTQQGANGRGIVMDVAEDDSVARALSELTESFPAPQILINNAGITRDGLLMRMTSDDWQAVLNTNLTAIYRLTKNCLKGMMKNRWGRIINLSSVVAGIGNPGQANYAAAKAGIEGFSRALAREIGSRHITVNTVAPGFVTTDMTRALPEAQQQALLAQIPLGRLAQPEEIAALVAFLATEDAAYISGQTIHVNGGMYMG
jgi:3-oxoacyl-[acyl-carrier protein] reductase